MVAFLDVSSKHAFTHPDSNISNGLYKNLSIREDMIEDLRLTM
jgi:hypothetical protein